LIQALSSILADKTDWQEWGVVVMSDLVLAVWLISDIPAMVWAHRLARRYRNPNTWHLVGETRARRARRLRMYRM
jgi:hypothetical protein